jgi:hypothetical protein
MVKVNTQLALYALGIFLQVGPQKALVKTDNQGFELVLLDKVVERPARILATTERDDAVVIVLAAVLLNEVVEYCLFEVPVNL